MRDSGPYYARGTIDVWQKLNMLLEYLQQTETYLLETVSELPVSVLSLRRLPAPVPILIIRSERSSRAETESRGANEERKCCIGKGFCRQAEALKPLKYRWNINYLLTLI